MVVGTICIITEIVLFTSMRLMMRNYRILMNSIHTDDNSIDDCERWRMKFEKFKTEAVNAKTLIKKKPNTKKLDQ